MNESSCPVCGLTIRAKEIDPLMGVWAHILSSHLHEMEQKQQAIGLLSLVEGVKNPGRWWEEVPDGWWRQTIERTLAIYHDHLNGVK